MTDTISLLESIGKDASLRRAPAEDLARALDGLNASEALKQAAVSGDSRYLSPEFGETEFGSSNHPTNTSQTIPGEEEEEEPEPPKDGGKGGKTAS